MKAMVILGSRNSEGQTARAAGALVEGLAAAGGQSETAILPTMHIERCRQCDESGWGTCRSEGRCVIEDDFAPLVEKLRAADAVVFATPVYFGDLSESMRAFVDRLRRTCMHQDGKHVVVGKCAVGICVAGGGGAGAPSCAASLDKALRTCGFDTLDYVLARKQNLEMKLEFLQATGKWLAGLPSGRG